MVTDAVKKSPKAAAAAKSASAPEAKKTETKAAAKPAVKKAAASTAAASGKVKVTQMIGSIGRRSDQQATLVGLGLNKRHKSRVLEDTPSVRGMIYKVRHLVKVENA